MEPLSGRLESILREVYGFTTRELKVVAYIPDGLTRKEIAEKLNVSVHTVDTQLAQCYRKLGVKDKAEAVAKLYSVVFPSVPANFFCFG